MFVLHCSQLFLPLILLLLRGVPGAVAGTSRPIIGVLTVPVAESEACETLAATWEGRLHDPVESCFEAFYVQWLEAAGLRVAVIPYDAPPAMMNELLNRCAQHARDCHSCPPARPLARPPAWLPTS